jgi:hypothetical protein
MSTIPYHLGRSVCAFIAASATFVATQSLAVPNYD